MKQVDILVAGGGIAGLTAAARFSADGWHVALVDPAPADLSGSGDLRTTAFLQPSIATLETAGAWSVMAPHGAALRIMRIIDAGGAAREIRETADFSPQDAGHELFGWNVPNHPARTALIDLLDARANVDLLHQRSVTGYVARLDRAFVTLSDGTRLSARLVVAADGRDSQLRRLADIAHRRWDYGQKALVFAATHDLAHNNVSTEIHRTGGPLTLVPMPDLGGEPCSSVVWMMPGPRAEALKGHDDPSLASELQAETMGLFGALEIAGPRAIWPIISQVALRLTAPRLALIAEAAHVMPPIGAQGLNTSLHDIETLAGLIANGSDPGAEKALGRYNLQLPGLLARVAGIDLLNRAAQTEIQSLRDLRRQGLAALHRITPLRQLAIRAGLGG